MDQNELHQRDPDDNTDQSAAKGEWLEPKLTFVKPTLTRHGELTEVTGQFFGGFSVDH